MAEDASVPGLITVSNEVGATDTVIDAGYRARINSVAHGTLLPSGLAEFITKSSNQIEEGEEEEGGDGEEEGGDEADKTSPGDGSYAKKRPDGERLFGLALPLLVKAIDEELNDPGGGGNDDDETQGDETIGSGNVDFPVIPPRGLTEIFRLPEDTANDAVWFRVLTPREIKGIDGPYSENELKDMYKMGQLQDSTLLWREGERDWTQLLFNKELRPRLLQLPLLPPRIGTSDPFADLPDDSEGASRVDEAKEARAYNPIVALPQSDEIQHLKPLYSIPMSNLCTRCGAFAVGHLAGHGRNEVDMVMLRRLKDYPVDLMSEVVPGFIYIGHAASAKLNVLLDMNISLVLNCTNNLANPPDRVPYYRGKVVALKDKPKSERPANMGAMIDLLDRACDWCENERLVPERAALSDPIPEPLKLKRTTDRYGRYVRTAEEIGIKRRAGMDGQKKPPPRILMWSRKGLDRPCFVAAAYMIKFMGMDVERALNIIETARPGAALSRAYRAALDEFSKKYTLGELLCTDCISNTRLEGEARKKEEEKGGGGEEQSFGAAAMSSSSSPLGPTHPQPCYTQFALHMQQTHPPGPDYNPLRALGDSAQYLPKIMLGRALESGWTGLLDLQLVSRRLGNAAMRELFASLEATQCLPHLRIVSLKGNELSCTGLIPILDTITNCSELLTLDLSCNKVGPEGSSRLASYLLSNTSVTALDCSSNPLGDEGVAAIFQSITMLRAEFEQDAEGVLPTTYNRTLTSLDCGATDLGHEAAAALINVFRDNETLTTLSLDFNVEFTAKDMKHVFNSLRSYNRTLQRLSLANTPVSTKSIGYLGRTFENADMPLMRLDLSFCTLASTHLSYLSKAMLLARHLSHLSLNSNDLGDLGGEHLAHGIRGNIDADSGQLWPPLVYVDASFCSIEEEGCRAVLEALCSRPTIRAFNLSYNNVGEDIEESGVCACLRLSHCTEIRLNGCNLGSKGASALFGVLTDTSPGTLGSSLRGLYLADNKIHDRSAESLSRLLNFNMVVEVLDLGFNLFTAACVEQMQRAKEVTSSDGKEKKLFSLTVNMLGNNCDPHMLDMPGLSRSKTSFRFGIKASSADPINKGFTHVPESARKLHLLRLDAHHHAQAKTGKVTLPIERVMSL